MSANSKNIGSNGTMRKENGTSMKKACRTEGNMVKRIISVMIVIIMVMGIINFRGEALAEASGSYDASKALEYAKNHWNDGKGLCAEFVSDCINAGGAGSWSRGATTLIRLLKESGMGTVYRLELNSDMSITAKNYEGKLSPGDAVFYYCSNCLNVDGCPYIHVVLCNGNDSNGLMKAYSHNNANKGEKAYYYSKKCWSCKTGDVTCAYVYHFDRTDGSNDNGLGEPVMIPDKGYKVYCGNGNSLVLDIHNFGEENGSNLEVYMDKTTDDANQIFDFKNIPGTAYYYIKARHSGKYLHISDGNDQHANVHTWDCLHINGVWQLFSAGGNKYYIQNVSNGSFLDNSGGSAVNGNNVWTYELNKTDAQIWSLVSEGDAHAPKQHIYYKVNAKSGLYILDKASTGRRLGCMPYGTEVEVIQKSSSSKWWKVRWGNTIGYSYSTYLTYNRTS